MVAINRKKEAVIAASDIKDWISYNPKTGEFRWIKGRGNKKAGDIITSINAEGYYRVTYNGITVKAHRLAWFYCYGKFPNFIIDHLDNNRMNNRIQNLRDVDYTENNQNRPHSAHWLGGYKAASKNKCKSRNIVRAAHRGIKYYTVVVRKNNKQIYFGNWHALEEALAVRDEMLEHGWSREYFEQKYPHKVKKRKAACAKQ